MAIQSINPEGNIKSANRVRSSNLSPYPVDMSSFLALENSTLDTTGGLHPAYPIVHSPITIAQYTLAHWNQYLATGYEQYRKAFLTQANWLVEHQIKIAEDASGWPISSPSPVFYTKGSWLSAVAQGCGLSVLARGYQLTQDETFLEGARRVVHTFERDILDGGVSAPIGRDGVFFEEVATYPAAHTLNGLIFALIGLHDYAAIAGNSCMPQCFQHCKATLHNVFDEFDLGFWTRIDLLQRDLATPAQLAQQTMLLEALAGCTECSHCAEQASRWQRYQRGPFSLLRYELARHKALFKQVLLRRVRAVIMSQSPTANSRPVQRLCVCVPVTNHPAPGGVGTFLDRLAHVMGDRWQIEYVTQRIGSDAGERVMRQFGRAWMTPWHFPQIWLYMLLGVHKLLSLMHQGAKYGLIMPQDGVFTGAFAAFVGKLTGVRVVCFDHSALTWYKSRAYRVERRRYVDGRGWPWPFRRLVLLLLTFYWPSLHILARFATAQADHLLSPGVTGDEIDEICRDLQIPPSRVTRFNVTVGMQPYEALSAEERAALRASMNIPIDALVIAINVRLEMEKGLDISMESISRTLSALPPELRERVRVIIAGDGQLRGWLEDEIRQRKLSHVCWMMGNIPSKEVISLLAVSDISLHTSTRGVCMPAAVLEGMAAGCAVIASTEPLANVRVLAEGRGIVVPAGAVEQTSEALERLLRDTDLRDRMGKAAREYIALHHSVEAFRRVLLRASYWSDVDQLLETQAELLEAYERTEREQ